MSEESAPDNKWRLGLVAVFVIVGAGYSVYRRSQPDLGNVAPINMSREELMRGAMIDGPGEAAHSVHAPEEPKTVTLKKGGP